MKMALQHLFFLGTLLVLSSAQLALAQDPGMCTYSTYKWNVISKSTTDVISVNKPRAALSANEMDAGTGCSVCEQDQVELSFAGLRPFKVCNKVAHKVRDLITQLQAQKAPLFDVVAYRPGMTRGAPDAHGNRTGFSNHSFGIALDINTEQNGLYENCVSFGPHCRLRKGGAWRPDQTGSLSADSAIVLAFKQQGFLWGGEVAGQQKDFMHFSPSGY